MSYGTPPPTGPTDGEGTPQVPAGDPTSSVYEAPSSSPQAPPPPSPQAGYSYSSAPPPAYGAGVPAPGTYGGPPPASSTKATVSLVLGIVGILICGVAGIAAIVLGRQAQSEIAASKGALTGGGLAKAGLITGIVGTVFLVIQVIAVLSLMAARS